MKLSFPDLAYIPVIKIVVKPLGKKLISTHERSSLYASRHFLYSLKVPMIYLL